MHKQFWLAFILASVLVLPASAQSTTRPINPKPTPLQAIPKTADKPVVAPRVPTLTANEAKGIIQAYIDIIQKRTDMMGKYDKIALSNTLKMDFYRLGVREKNLDYADKWANEELWLSWDRARNFYTNHALALGAARKAINGPVPEATIIAIDKGMGQWQADEQEIQKLFQGMISQESNRALWLQYKNQLEATGPGNYSPGLAADYLRDANISHEQYRRLDSQVQAKVYQPALLSGLKMSLE